MAGAADATAGVCYGLAVPFEEPLVCVHVLIGKFLLFMAVKAKPLSFLREEDFLDRCLVDSVTGEALNRTRSVLHLPRVFSMEGMVLHYAIVLYVMVADGAQLRFVHGRNQG
jgi:hypothetical protein